MPIRLLKKWLIILDLYVQVSVLPPPPHGWENLHEWNGGKKTLLYYTLKENFYTARGQLMPAETSVPVTFRPKLIKKPVSAGTFRRLLLAAVWKDTKKKREEAGWTFPGPLEPDYK